MPYVNIQTLITLEKLWLHTQHVYHRTLTIWYFVIHLTHWDNSSCIRACVSFTTAYFPMRKNYTAEQSWANFVWASLCGKQDGAESVLPFSCTGTGEPANLQCHSSTATATARWTVRYLCMCVLRQLVFLLPPMLALVNLRATTLHCPNLSYATQVSSNVSAKLILTVWSHR